MARHTDDILGNRGFVNDTTAPQMVDPTYGGTMGPMPDYLHYVAAAPYVRRNLIARMLEAPRGFDNLPDADKRREVLKAIVELHPTSITGFNSQLSVENRDTPYGAAGEILQAPADVKRERPNPTFNFTERYGRPLSRFFDDWIVNLIMDPETKYPSVLTYQIGDAPADLLPDYIGMTCIFFEPDPTMRKIDKAWLCTNMWPLQGAPAEAQRNMTTGGESLEFSINFTSLAMVGIGVNQIAQILLNDMTLTGTNPYQRPAFVKEVQGAVQSGVMGYQEQLEAAAKVAVTR